MVYFTSAIWLGEFNMPSLTWSLSPQLRTYQEDGSGPWQSHTVDGSFEFRRENQLRLVVYPIIYKVLAPSQVLRWFWYRFLNHQSTVSSYNKANKGSAGNTSGSPRHGPSSTVSWEALHGSGGLLLRGMDEEACAGWRCDVFLQHWAHCHAVQDIYSNFGPCKSIQSHTCSIETTGRASTSIICCQTQLVLGCAIIDGKKGPSILGKTVFSYSQCWRDLSKEAGK